ncbi:MAG: excinuclease ABC subunit UvrC [bacterium]
MDLQEKVKALPDGPGVYMMRDGEGRIIYIGKAASLAKRVRSYFRPNLDSPKTEALVSHLADVEYIATETEVDALILECNLIKEHRPEYNVRLKDGKGYPYIKIAMEEEYPRILMVRRRQNDGGVYFGPFVNSQSLRRMIKLTRDLFPLCNCPSPVRRTGPRRKCLDYYMRRCLGPCAGGVDPAEYREVAEEACLFLRGKRSDLIGNLRRKMMEASENLAFELAANLRDKIRALEAAGIQQYAESSDSTDRDVLAFAREGQDLCMFVLQVRGGRILGREHFFLVQPESSAAEILSSFIEEYYDASLFIPGEVIVSDPIDEGREALEEWLERKRGGEVKIHYAQRGDKRHLADMARKNAELILEQERATRAKRDQSRALDELKGYLGLPELPQRIEAFDVSNIQGKQAVASMVSFVGGNPAKGEYRRFKIKTVEEEPNDFAMMKEAVSRRYKRVLSECRKMPDLILIDGGKGQLSSAIEGLEEVGARGYSIASLAKEEEAIFLPGAEEPLRIPPSSPALHLLRRVRDEAHRFALSYHRKLRKKALKRSSLDDIPGVGPRRKGELMRHFGSVKKISQATVEELMSVKGISEETARAIYRYYRTPQRNL